MKLAMVGLGRMGANMVRRLVINGHHVVAYNRTYERAEQLRHELKTLDPAVDGEIEAVDDLAVLVQSLPAPRVIWLMVPHGAVDDTIESLLEVGVEKGDLIIDGGNSNFNDSIDRAGWLQEEGIHFVDCGTSGGIWGLENGYSMMVGGSDEAFAMIEPAIKSLAPGENSGWGHVGPAGAGHFTKMVHNGIEYGMMQAFAEGFELMAAKEAFNLDLHQIARVWQEGSVVRSWLLDLTADALEQDPQLENLSDWVDDSGEGRWTVHESIDAAVPTPVLTLALMMRFRSRQESSLAGRMLAAMRAGFGGHAVKAAGDE